MTDKIARCNTEEEEGKKRAMEVWGFKASAAVREPSVQEEQLPRLVMQLQMGTAVLLNNSCQCSDE